MADNKEKELRDKMNALAKDKKSTAYLSARGALNDYLESVGRKTNRISGEPVNGKATSWNPDLKTPKGVINAQQDLSYVDESTPFGSSNYTVNPDGSVNRDVSLSKPEQDKLTGEQGIDLSIQEQIRKALAQIGNQDRTFNSSSLINPEFNKIDPSKFDVNQVQQSILGPQKDQLAQKHEREAQQFQAALLSRGIQPGSPRAAQEMQQLAARQSAEMRDLESASYGQAASVGASNAANANAYYTGQRGVLDQRGQQFDEQQAAINQPYADLANLNAAYGGVNIPQFSPTQFVDGAGIGLGFAGLANDKSIATLNANTQKAIAAANNAAQLKAAQIGASASGGGGSEFDPVSGTPPPNGSSQSGRTRIMPTMFGTTNANRGISKRFF